MPQDGMAEGKLSNADGDIETLWAFPLGTLEKDADVLLTFFDFRAEHWKHLAPQTWSSRRSRRSAPPAARARRWSSRDACS